MPPRNECSVHKWSEKIKWNRFYLFIYLIMNLHCLVALLQWYNSNTNNCTFLPRTAKHFVLPFSVYWVIELGMQPRRNWAVMWEDDVKRIIFHITNIATTKNLLTGNSKLADKNKVCCMSIWRKINLVSCRKWILNMKEVTGIIVQTLLKPLLLLRGLSQQ